MAQLHPGGNGTQPMAQSISWICGTELTWWPGCRVGATIIGGSRGRLRGQIGHFGFVGVIASFGDLAPNASATLTGRVTRAARRRVHERRVGRVGRA
jgi:hypothetical protein